MPYATLPLQGFTTNVRRDRLMVLAAFAEVWLAKRGHTSPIGINLLAKIQLPTLATLYGAMLAGVEYVLVGAGVPREIPLALDRLALHQPAEIRLEVVGLETGASAPVMRFDPSAHWDTLPAPLTRPNFLPIVSSTLLATALVRKATGRIDGLVVEGPTAGGHNAPPRGGLRRGDAGEPVYGERDMVDLDKIRGLGLPFWLAGGMGTRDGLQRALDSGATGIQVGTLFAFCQDSGMEPGIRESVLTHALRNAVTVRTDPRASPTGYPFKIVDWPDNPGRTETRRRLCDLGYLREAYMTPAGGVGFRCSGEPVAAYLAKGGNAGDTEGRLCLCNRLLATAGYPQRRADTGIELPIVTSGDELTRLADFLQGRTAYTASDVVEFLLDTSQAGVSRR
jgi:NAD(P)H-dependent flavin oxidoreductase YrpB (nitropropane dioxygenase family)